MFVHFEEPDAPPRDEQLAAFKAEHSIAPQRHHPRSKHQLCVVSTSPMGTLMASVSSEPSARSPRVYFGDRLTERRAGVLPLSREIEALWGQIDHLNDALPSRLLVSGRGRQGLSGRRSGVGQFGSRRARLSPRAPGGVFGGGSGVSFGSASNFASAAQRIETRGERKPVVFDGAPDRRRNGGVLVVGKINRRHGLAASQPLSSKKFVCPGSIS